MSYFHIYPVSVPHPGRIIGDCLVGHLVIVGLAPTGPRPKLDWTGE